MSRNAYGRALSRMQKEDRLLVKAIYRARKQPKSGFRNCGFVSLGSSNLCPKEWR
jgi:hypothetical protein